MCACICVCLCDSFTCIAVGGHTVTAALVIVAAYTCHLLLCHSYMCGTHVSIAVTENGKHLGPTAEFNQEQFQEMMKGELHRYIKRELNNVLCLSGDEQTRSIILMLKITEVCSIGHCVCVCV